MFSIDDGETSSTAVIPRGGYSCAGDDMKLMIIRQEGFQVPGRFPRLFLIRENPAIAPRGAQNPCSPSSHLARSSTSTPSRVWGSCLVRAMRTFGNASLIDRSGASSLSSVDSELMSSLA